jgi:hypothetical protein
MQLVPISQHRRQVGRVSPEGNDASTAQPAGQDFQAGIKHSSDIDDLWFTRFLACERKEASNDPRTSFGCRS